MVGLNEMKLDELKNKRLFEFIATGPRVDKEGDTIPMDEVDKALLGWMMRGGSISEKHSNVIIGRGLTFKEDNEGNRVVIGEIFDNAKSSDMAWDKIKNGEYSMVSIGGGAFEKTPNLHGGEDLKGLEILEVALCEEGMYPDANIIGLNGMAKSTPFFAKAKITLPIIHKDYVKGGKNMTDVEKGVTLEALDKLTKAVEELVMRAKKEDEEEKPEEDKPSEEDEKKEDSEDDEEEKKEVLVNGQRGIGGSGAVEPNEEGGTVIIPAGIDADAEDFGTVGDEVTDEAGVKITEKTIRKAVASELKKAGIRKASTPVPTVEKTVKVKKEVNPAWDILKGKSTINDFVKTSEIDHLQQKIDLRKAFESDMRGEE